MYNAAGVKRAALCYPSSDDDWVKKYTKQACAARFKAVIIPLLRPAFCRVVVLLQSGLDNLCGCLRWRGQETSQELSVCHFMAVEFKLTSGFLRSQIASNLSKQ
jgi:hypothetical protein